MSMKFFQKKAASNYTTKNWRDNKQAPYRSKMTLLAKPQSLIVIGVLSFLFQLFAINALISVLLAFQKHTNRLLHGGTPEKGALLKAIFKPILLQYPMGLLLLCLLFTFTSLLLCHNVYKSFRALDDIQNAGSNRWATIEELLKQYRIMWADPNIPYDGIGGIAVAHVRPSVLKKYKLDRLPYLDDTYFGDEADIDPEEHLASTGEDLSILKKNVEILRKELPEDEKGYAFLIADENTNAITYGITRAGKGVFFGNPVLDTFSRSRAIKDRASFFMADTKGVALRENYKMLVEREYDVLVFNMADPFFSNPFSPLFTAVNNYEDYLFPAEAMTKIDNYKRLDFATQDIASIASILYIRPHKGDNFFVDNARALFRAITIALIDYCLKTNQKNKICLYAISKTIANMMGIKINRKNHPYLKKYVTEDRSLDDLFADYKGKSALDLYFGELAIDHPARDAYASIRIVNDAAQTLAGIAGELLIALDPYVRSGNARLTADNAFDFRKMGFGDKPQAIFLVYPDSDSSNEDIAKLFTESAFRELVREADATEEGECERTVIFDLDEFGNLFTIPKIGSKMSAALSRNIRFFLMLQNIGQLDKYDPFEKKTILSNAGITFYLKSNDKETNDEIMSRLDKRTVATFTRNGEETKLKKSIVDSTTKENMMSRHELEQLQFGESVILRVSKTMDLANASVDQYPILNRGADRMIPSFWYLKHKKIAWKDLPIDNTHVDIALEGYALELLPDHLLEKEAETESIAQTEVQKQSFKSAIQKAYKRDGNYWRNCTEVWEQTAYIQQIREALFTEEKIKMDPFNLTEGQKMLMSGTIAEFTQWLEMEDNINSIHTVARIIELDYGGENLCDT